jgi:pilus assembly protein Flp/PilA
MQRFWTRIWNNTLGQDLLEYALAAGLVAIVAVAAMPTLSTVVGTLFTKIGSILNSSLN